MKKITIGIIIFSALFSVAGCYYDKEEVLYPGNSECQLNAKFSANVFPIIETKCATTPDCHASGSTNAAGPLTNYTLIHNLAPVIRGQVVSGIMPKTGSLTSTELQTIVCWIDSGAPNN
jgi:hypothetical protein